MSDGRLRPQVERGGPEPQSAGSPAPCLAGRQAAGRQRGPHAGLWLTPSQRRLIASPGTITAIRSRVLPERNQRGAGGGGGRAVSPAWSPQLIWARAWARVQVGGPWGLHGSRDGPRGCGRDGGRRGRAGGPHGPCPRASTACRAGRQLQEARAVPRPRLSRGYRLPSGDWTSESRGLAPGRVAGVSSRPRPVRGCARLCPSRSSRGRSPSGPGPPQGPLLPESPL